MSIWIPQFSTSKVVRGSEAEILGSDRGKITLLADSSATGGALSTVRVSLNRGADGARPHRHENSAEMFYIIEGKVDVLSGSEVVKAEAGDVIVVPPKMPHAFAAHRHSSAEILIVIVPGVERFEYFRQTARIARGEEAPQTIEAVQELYDNWFLNSAEWEQARKSLPAAE